MTDPLPDQRAADPLLRTLLGAVIRRTRHDRQQTLSEVAARAGVSVPYLSEIERGRKEPSSEVLAAVCRALGLDLLDLVSRTYIDLVGQQLEVGDTAPLRVHRLPRPVRSLQTVRRLRPGSASGRSGEVVALAA